MSTCQWLFIGVIFSYGLWQVNENFYFLLRYSQDVEIGRQGFISDDVIQHFTRGVHDDKGYIIYVTCVLLRRFVFCAMCPLIVLKFARTDGRDHYKNDTSVNIHIYSHAHMCDQNRTGEGCKSYYSFFTGKKDVNKSIHVSIHRVCTLLQLLFDFSFPDLWSSDQTRFQFCREFFGSFLF